MSNKTSNKDKVTLCAQHECCGCMACYNVCPSNGIRFVENQDKVLVPLINYDVCIACGRCRAVCPVIHQTIGNEPIAAFASYTKNKKDVKTCSSGGIATAFYRSVLQRGGVVVGAIEQGAKPPKLQCAESLEQIEAFKGSKYVFVQPGQVYKEIEKELKTGRECLFIGVPCQVDALIHYLGKQYDNLYTVDIICHGTPSFEYLREYLKVIAKEREIEKYSFRGERDYRLVVYSHGRIIYNRRCDEDVYFASFLQGLIHREVCYQCHYAGEKRVSDITIGDYWGASETVLNGYKGKISAVLINTEKGKKFWDTSVNELIFEDTPVISVIKGNSQLRRPSLKHAEREVFLNELRKSGSFNLALRATSIVKRVKLTRIENILLLIPRLVKQKILTSHSAK